MKRRSRMMVMVMKVRWDDWYVVIEEMIVVARKAVGKLVSTPGKCVGFNFPLSFSRQLICEFDFEVVGIDVGVVATDFLKSFCFCLFDFFVPANSEIIIGRTFLTCGTGPAVKMNVTDL